MDGLNQGGKMQLFRVDVGHTSVTVECRNMADAIPEAKRKLSIEVPRMWDMIRQLEEHRFQVSQILP